MELATVRDLSPKKVVMNVCSLRLKAMLPLCFWFSKVFQYLLTENLPTENLRLSFVFSPSRLHLLRKLKRSSYCTIL